MNPNDITNLIRNRRSTYPKNYSGKKVDKKIIEEMLENANWAPTHKLTEPWRFVVFEGEGLKKLADFQADRYKQRWEGSEFNQVKYEKLLGQPLKCSHIIAITMARDPEQRIPEIEEIASVSCAVQNMWLTAAAHDLGCYWSTGGVTYDEEAKEFFGLGPFDTLMGFFMIGTPDENNDPRESRRRPISEKVTWVTR